MNKFTIIGSVLVLAVLGVGIGIFLKASPVPPKTPATTGDTSSVTTTTYTLAQVQSHATQADCWTTINGSVYNLTDWIAQHPGGEQAILGLCGKDGSAAFNKQHGGKQKQADVLATFKIGALAQ